MKEKLSSLFEGIDPNPMRKEPQSLEYKGYAYYHKCYGHRSITTIIHAEIPQHYKDMLLAEREIT